MNPSFCSLPTTIPASIPMSFENCRIAVLLNSFRFVNFKKSLEGISNSAAKSIRIFLMRRQNPFFLMEMTKQNVAKFVEQAKPEYIGRFSSNSQSYDNLIIIVKRSAVEKRAANMRQKYQCNSTFCEKRLQLNAKIFSDLGMSLHVFGEMRFQFFQINGRNIFTPCFDLCFLRPCASAKSVFL